MEFTLRDESEEEEVLDTALFKEPDDYYRPPEPPTFTDYTLLSGEKLRLRLVGKNPLWGHMLWNAGQVVADYLQQHVEKLIKNKNILELGAGAGLPGLVSAVLGANKVVLTDYPDVDLIENLEYNIHHCTASSELHSRVTPEGYLWGAPLPEGLSNTFDTIILADLIFNHSEHAKLISTVQMALRQNSSATALVFFSPHRPWLLDKDMAFFHLAREGGFLVEQVVYQIMEKPMFAVDRGDELLRRTVFGYELRWKE